MVSAPLLAFSTSPTRFILAYAVKVGGLVKGVIAFAAGRLGGYVETMTEPILTFGPFTLDASRNELCNSGAVVNVSQRATTLLAALIDANGQTISKSELMEKAWPGMVVEEGNLTVQIAALRKALGSDADGHDLIVTVPRVGYRLLLPQPALTAEPLVLPSLAVLPFQNLSGEAEQDYFADGVVEDMITALSRFKSFAVVTKNAAFLYKGRTMDLKAVSAELGARYVLEGSVRRAGSRLRITAQLVEAATGAHLWAERFDGALDEVFDFQDRITESVATLVEPSIQSAELKRARRERPGSVAAYDLYLQAVVNLWTDIEKDQFEAYSLLRQALALDPDNAICLALSAMALMRRNLRGWPPIGSDDRSLCAVLVRRALQHAGEDAKTMAYCGDALFHFVKDYDWAMATLQQAVEMNPNNLDVVVITGIANLHCGDVDNALAHFHRALRLSPRDPSAHLSLTGIAHVAMIRGDWREALDWASRALALTPNNQPTHWMLVAANAHLGRMAEAHRYLNELRRLRPGVTVAGIWAGQPQKTEDRCANILEGLRLAGLLEA